MTIQFPVHKDDVDQLLRIRRYLIGYRTTNGWTQPQLSQMINGTNGMAYDLESNVTWQWRFSRLQDWPVPFGMYLRARLMFPDDPTGQLEESIESHPEVAPMLSLSQRPEGAWRMWQRAYLTSALRIARIELGINTRAMGQRLGVAYKAVNNWEAGGNEVMLAKVLHYARMLGGYVRLGLGEPGDGAE